MPLLFPNAIRCLINDLGTVLPALYRAAILFITDASWALLEPFVPDKYFFGTRDFLSFGTLFRRLLFATSSSLDIVILRVATSYKGVYTTKRPL